MGGLKEENKKQAQNIGGDKNNINFPSLSERRQPYRKFTYFTSEIATMKFQKLCNCCML